MGREGSWWVGCATRTTPGLAQGQGVSGPSGGETGSVNSINETYAARLKRMQVWQAGLIGPSPGGCRA
jgi:hypothetical protein